MITLGVDVGGTRSKWAVAIDGAIQQSGQAAPLRKHLFLEAETHSFESVCREIKLSVPKLHKVTMGITGVLRNTEQQLTATRVISDVWGIPSTDVTIMSDIELSYASQFQGRDGILISAGTGSIAAFRDKSGEITFIGGKGYLIGDEGSGYWIGAEGIRRSIRFFEENDCDEALGNSLKRFYGIVDWREILPIVYSAEGRSQIARAAQTVSAAATEGSQLAIGIVKKAVADLARLYEIARRASSADELRVVGGVLSEASPLRKMLAEFTSQEIPKLIDQPEWFAAVRR